MTWSHEIYFLNKDCNLPKKKMPDCNLLKRKFKDWKKRTNDCARSTAASEKACYGLACHSTARPPTSKSSTT